MELLVSRNKMNLLRNYYLSIKNDIIAKLEQLYDQLMSDISMVKNKETAIGIDKSDSLTEVSKFIANTEDALIVNHEKYKELIETYNKYISEFYNRMTELRPSYEEDFDKHEVGRIVSEWKFHYTDEYGNALPVEHKFGPCNITCESEIFELSQNHYIYRTNEDVIYDVDYKTKTVYVLALDSKVDLRQYHRKNAFNKVQENAKIISLFAIENSETVYILVDIGRITGTVSNYFGKATDQSKIHELVIKKYDYVNHRFDFVDYTSSIYVKESLLKDSKIKFLNSYLPYDTNGNFYYFVLGEYIGRVIINTDGKVTTLTESQKIGECAYKIQAAVIDDSSSDDNRYLIATPTNKPQSVGVFNITTRTNINFSSPDIRNFDFTTKSTEFANGEDGTVYNLFFVDNVGNGGQKGLYAATGKNIWYSSDRFVSVSKDQRVSVISETNLSFTNKEEYMIDEFGYIYVLGGHEKLYCAKTLDGKTLQDHVVESPTRFADKLINLSNLIKKSYAGYVSAPKNTIFGGSGKDVLFSFVENDTYYAVSTNGAVSYTSISDSVKHWNTKNSISQGKDIIAYTIYNNETLYFATADYNIYTIAMSSVMDESNISATIIGDIILGTAITALIRINDELYVGCNNGSIHVYLLDPTGYHSTFISASLGIGAQYYNEENFEKYHINNGDAIGNIRIVQMENDGSNLIIAGIKGRIASCALNSNIWTTFQGKSGTNGVLDIDSNIYCDGEALNGKDIVKIVNYTNTKLIVVAKEGYIASCNLITGNWTKFNGSLESHGKTGLGPGIFNNGTILGPGISPTAVARSGSTLFVGGQNGRIGSINILTGGLTEYRGTVPDILSTIQGPGYFYEGNDLASNDKITSMINDNDNGTIIFSGTESFVMSYSPEAGEILKDVSSKMYYVARRQSNYDYLSSLMVKVTKGTLNESIPIYPPKEYNVTDPFIDGYNSQYHIGKNGKYIWRISTQLDVAYFSENEGETFKQIEIDGMRNIPSVGTHTIRSLPGITVSSSGRAVMAMNIAGAVFFVLCEASIKKVTWLSASDSITGITQDDINKIMFIDDALETIMLGNHTFKINKETYSISKVTTGRTSIYDKSFNPIMDEGLEYTSDGLIMQNGGVFGNAKDVIEQYVSTILNAKVKSIPDFWTSLNNIHFVTILTDGRVTIVTIAYKMFDFGFSEDNYSISHALLSLKEIGKENSVAFNTDDFATDITTWVVEENTVRVNVDTTGLKGFLSFDVVTNGGENKGVLISLSASQYGNNYVFEGKVIYVNSSRFYVIAFDKKTVTLYLAHYTTSDTTGVVLHTNSIHVFENVDSTRYTPLRALSDAWKTVQVKTSSTITACDLLLKLNTTVDASDSDFNAKLETLRYQVMISNLTKGSFVLYEVEKSTGISKTDDETKQIEPFFKVIACDRFDDRIVELYTSRLDTTRRSSFTPNGISESKLPVTMNFSTFIRFNDNNLNDVYQIMVKPMNTLSEYSDCEFYIEPKRYENSEAYVKSVVNRIATAEFKFSESQVNKYTFGGNSKGFLSKTPIDIAGGKEKPFGTNIDDAPQYEDLTNDNEQIGIADTYACVFEGHGDGLFDKSHGIITSVANKYVFVPYSINKRDLRYNFDQSASDEIKRRGDENLYKGTKSLHGMRNFSVFSKGVVNSGDYYIDHNGKGRIASVEGLIVTPYGLQEVISSIDGKQKRNNDILEQRDGNIWRTVRNSYDKIKERRYESSFDLVDRYTIFESPYYEMQAWWANAQEAITDGNDRMLYLSYPKAHDKALYGTVAPHRLPEENVYNYIENQVDKAYEGGDKPTSSGIQPVEGEDGLDNKTVAIKELLDEKWPLEKREGNFDNCPSWTDMCFVRKYRVTYTDGSSDIYYEVESPRVKVDPTANKVTQSTDSTTNKALFKTYFSDNTLAQDTPLPEDDGWEVINDGTIPRTLYMYIGTNQKDVEEDNPTYETSEVDAFEGIGTETFYVATKWCYERHKWEIVKDEVISRKYEWTDNMKAVLTGEYSEKVGPELVVFNDFARGEKSDDFHTVTDEKVVKWYLLNQDDASLYENSLLNHENNNYNEADYQNIVICESGKTTVSSNINLFHPAVDIDEYFPRPCTEVVGEKLEAINWNIAEVIQIAQVQSKYVEFVNDDKNVNGFIIKGKNELRLNTFRRGLNLWQSDIVTETDPVTEGISKINHEWFTSRKYAKAKNYVADFITSLVEGKVAGSNIKEATSNSDGIISTLSVDSDNDRYIYASRVAQAKTLSRVNAWVDAPGGVSQFADITLNTLTDNEASSWNMPTSTNAEGKFKIKQYFAYALEEDVFENIKFSIVEETDSTVNEFTNTETNQLIGNGNVWYVSRTQILTSTRDLIGRCVPSKINMYKYKLKQLQFNGTTVSDLGKVNILIRDKANDSRDGEDTAMSSSSIDYIVETSSKTLWTPFKYHEKHDPFQIITEDLDLRYTVGKKWAGSETEDYKLVGDISDTEIVKLFAEGNNISDYIQGKVKRTDSTFVRRDYIIAEGDIDSPEHEETAHHIYPTHMWLYVDENKFDPSKSFTFKANVGVLTDSKNEVYLDTDNGGLYLIARYADGAVVKKLLPTGIKKTVAEWESFWSIVITIDLSKINDPELDSENERYLISYPIYITGNNLLYDGKISERVDSKALMLFNGKDSDNNPDAKWIAIDEENQSGTVEWASDVFNGKTDFENKPAKLTVTSQKTEDYVVTHAATYTEYKTSQAGAVSGTAVTWQERTGLEETTVDKANSYVDVHMTNLDGINVSSSSIPDKVGFHMPLDITLVASSGYALPAAISITTGTQTLAQTEYTYTRSSSDSQAYISVPGEYTGGDVNITVNCVEV